jgi:hypothetical protein
MKDELKSLKPPKNGNYIINLESKSQGNKTHWSNLSILGKKCYYQDSFGVLPRHLIIQEEVISFCEKIPKSHLAFFEKHIQHLKADTLRWFCVGLSIHIKNNPDKDLYDAYSDYLNMYSYDTTKNIFVFILHLERLLAKFPLMNNDRS